MMAIGKPASFIGKSVSIIGESVSPTGEPATSAFDRRRGRPEKSDAPRIGVSTRLNEEEKETLSLAAARHGMSESQYIRMVLQVALHKEVPEDASLMAVYAEKYSILKERARYIIRLYSRGYMVAAASHIKPEWGVNEKFDTAMVEFRGAADKLGLGAAPRSNVRTLADGVIMSSGCSDDVDAKRHYRIGQLMAGYALGRMKAIDDVEDRLLATHALEEFIEEFKKMSSWESIISGDDELSRTLSEET